MSDRWFLIFVIGNIALIAVLISIPMIVRWRKMTRLYPDGPFTAERVYRSVAGNFGWQAARGCSHHLAVGKEGMRLFPIRPFERLCPAILIPWDAIYLMQGKPSSFACDCLIIEISGLSSPLCFSFLWRHGDALSVIQQHWDEHRFHSRNGSVSQSKSSPSVLSCI